MASATDKIEGPAEEIARLYRAQFAETPPPGPALAKANPEPAQPKEPTALEKRARDLGLSRGEIESFSSERDLQAAINLLENSRKYIASQEPVRNREEESEPDSGEWKPYDIKLSKDDIDEQLINELQSMNKHNADAIKSLTNHIAEIHQYLNRTRQEEMFRWFDNKIQSLPEEYQKYLGSGSTFSYGDDTSEFRYRSNLIQAIAERAARRTDLTLDQIFERELRAELSDVIDRDRKRAEAIQRQKEASLMRPTPQQEPDIQVGSSEDQRKARFIETYRSMLRDNGAL